MVDLKAQQHNSGLYISLERLILTLITYNLLCLHFFSETVQEWRQTKKYKRYAGLELDMNVNNNRPQLWKTDVSLSVDFYNNWFLNFAPQAYRDARNEAIDSVDAMLLATQNLYEILPTVIKSNPEILSILRMATAPPIARDRLIGLARVSPALVKRLESGKLPSRMSNDIFDMHLTKIIEMIKRLLDKDIFPWLANKTTLRL